MALRGYIGDFGDGKTGNMVLDAHKLAWPKDRYGVEHQGRAVYSNLTLYDWRVKYNPWYVGFVGNRMIRGRWEAVNTETFGRQWSRGEPLRHWKQLLGLNNAIVLLDEIEDLFDARNWGKFPPELFRKVTQQRKDGLDIWWASPMNSLVDNRLRGLTPEVWHCVKVPPRKPGEPARPGDLIVMTMWDMRAKRARYPRYSRLGYHMWDLYDTWEVMGDMDGNGYEVGASEQKAGLRPEQKAVLIRLCAEREEDHPFLRREADEKHLNQGEAFWGKAKLLPAK